MLIVIPIVASILAFIQNSLMFSFGLKEQAIFGFPLPFIGIFLAELFLIWSGFFVIRRFVKAQRYAFLIAWSLIILCLAESVLPVSYFSNYFKHSQREGVLNMIQVTGKSVEVLASQNEVGSRFALTYRLQFPKTGHYLTFPSYIESTNKPRIYGNYFRKIHAEYYEESFTFEPGNSYEFTVVFDSGSKKFDSRDRVNIDICDGKDYFMACRVIRIDIGDLLNKMLALNPTPETRDPYVPVDNFWDVAEKSIHLADLKIISTPTKPESPLEFAFAITNTGDKHIRIPDQHFQSLISINYAWEAVDEDAKKTQVGPHLLHFGNYINAGGYIGILKKSALAPGEKVVIQDRIDFVRTWHISLSPGKYKLHLRLFNNYSTDINNPIQDLIATFSVVP